MAVTRSCWLLQGAPAETFRGSVDESAVNFADYLRQYRTLAQEERPRAPANPIHGGGEESKFGGRRKELKSRFRSALSPWIDFSNRADIVRYKLTGFPKKRGKESDADGTKHSRARLPSNKKAVGRRPLKFMCSNKRLIQRRPKTLSSTSSSPVVGRGPMMGGTQAEQLKTAAKASLASYRTTQRRRQARLGRHHRSKGPARLTDRKRSYKQKQPSPAQPPPRQ